jgi:hypothetical protein
MSRGKYYKPMLLGLAVVLLAGVFQVQRSMTDDRARLGLVRDIDQAGMPPVLAFTTVALGGFRGLIANALWMRANDLQEQDKYFEMVQLADWITKLEPRFVQVWTVQAWNMAYNISVKFTDPADRWRWVERGIQLLRDEGLRYNPDETLIYRELSWFFRHKMGQNLDDAHLYYKAVWFNQMNQLLGARPNYDELLSPQADEARERVRLLREHYKMDPAFMREVDELYGPLEWRLPEAHAIYWAETGRRRGKKDDQDRLLREIYQTMQVTFRRGAVYENLDGTIAFVPNLDNVEKINRAYEQSLGEVGDPTRPHAGHMNFLKEAVYFLYLYNRHPEARKWFRYLREQYPDEVPRGQSLEEFAIARISEEVDRSNVDRTTGFIIGMLRNFYIELVKGNKEQALLYQRMAEVMWNRHEANVKSQQGRIGLATQHRSLRHLQQRVLQEMLDPERGLRAEHALILRSRALELGLLTEEKESKL